MRLRRLQTPPKWQVSCALDAGPVSWRLMLAKRTLNRGFCGVLDGLGAASIRSVALGAFVAAALCGCRDASMTREYEAAVGSVAFADLPNNYAEGELLLRYEATPGTAGAAPWRLDTQVLRVRPESEIYINDRVATLRDVRADDRVRVTYYWERGSADESANPVLVLAEIERPLPPPPPPKFSTVTTRPADAPTEESRDPVAAATRDDKE